MQPSKKHRPQAFRVILFTTKVKLFSHLFKNLESVCLSVCLFSSEYLRGDVLPAEQHAASDLQSLLDTYADVKALNTHGTSAFALHLSWEYGGLLVTLGS